MRKIWINIIELQYRGYKCPPSPLLFPHLLPPGCIFITSDKSLINLQLVSSSVKWEGRRWSAMFCSWGNFIYSVRNIYPLGIFKISSRLAVSLVSPCFNLCLRIFVFMCVYKISWRHPPTSPLHWWRYSLNLRHLAEWGNSSIQHHD